MRSKIRRINFYGGPCSGKSTTAAYIFSELKKYGLSVELVDEYIKFWTYIPRSPKGYDALYVQAKQIHKEDTILRSGTDLIVSDSPTLLQYFYAKHHSNPCQQQMLDIALEFEQDYPSFNILLRREDKDYKELGRYETLQQAKDIDVEFRKYLNSLNVNYIETDSRTDELFNYIIEEIS